jgi:hypothetical protein
MTSLLAAVGSIDSNTASFLSIEQVIAFINICIFRYKDRQKTMEQKKRKKIRPLIHFHIMI